MDLNVKKQQLEEAIRQLIVQFRQETGLKVDIINVERVKERVGPFSEFVDKVSVKTYL